MRKAEACRRFFNEINNKTAVAISATAVFIMNVLNFGFKNAGFKALYIVYKVLSIKYHT